MWNTSRILLLSDLGIHHQSDCLCLCARTRLRCAQCRCCGGHLPVSARICVVLHVMDRWHEGTGHDDSERYVTPVGHQSLADSWTEDFLNAKFAHTMALIATITVSYFLVSPSSLARVIFHLSRFCPQVIKDVKYVFIYRSWACLLDNRIVLGRSALMKPHKLSQLICAISISQY